MKKFLKALEEASKKSTPTNLHRLVEMAKAIVEADPDKYKWRGSYPSTYPSTWDTVWGAETDLESGDYIPVSIIVKMEGIALWYFGTRGDFWRHSPGVWEKGDVKILHEAGRWSVLVRRAPKRGCGVRWEETRVRNASAAFRLARASQE